MGDTGDRAAVGEQTKRRGRRAGQSEPAGELEELLESWGLAIVIPASRSCPWSSRLRQWGQVHVVTPTPMLGMTVRGTGEAATLPPGASPPLYLPQFLHLQMEEAQLLPPRVVSRVK